MPQIEPGMEWECSGLQVRTVAGRKGPSDVRVEVRSTAWVPIDYSALGVLYATLWENEERLYPRSEGKRGGRKLWSHLRRCESDLSGALAALAGEVESARQPKCRECGTTEQVKRAAVGGLLWCPAHEPF